MHTRTWRRATDGAAYTGQDGAVLAVFLFRRHLSVAFWKQEASGRSRFALGVRRGSGTAAATHESSASAWAPQLCRLRRWAPGGGARGRMLQQRFRTVDGDSRVRCAECRVHVHAARRGQPERCVARCFGVEARFRRLAGRSCRVGALAWALRGMSWLAWLAWPTPPSNTPKSHQPVLITAPTLPVRITPSHAPPPRRPIAALRRRRPAAAAHPLPPPVLVTASTLPSPVLSLQAPSSSLLIDPPAQLRHPFPP